MTASGAGAAERAANKTIELTVDRVAKGGAALGTGPDGRVVFVTGALPGERVLARVGKDTKRFVEARAVEIWEPSDLRVRPACPHVADGCGGCDWQHAAPSLQSQLRVDVVADALLRLGRLDDVSVVQGPELAVGSYRTIVRAAVVGGRAGYRRARSHEVVVPRTCSIAHPRVEELLVDGRYGDATEVSIKIGARTGERMVVVTPDAAGVVVPNDVLVVGRDELKNGRLAFIHEEVGGRIFRISADSFFQCRPDGAEALVELARDAIAGYDGPLLDAYSGVGLFGGLLADGRPLTAVESNRSSVADAEVNLAGAGAVVATRVERWHPVPMGVVVADPARRGLEAPGVAALTATEAAAIVLVSCDAASLARDARLLVDTGYSLDQVTVVDLFGQTSHVETVSTFSLPKG